jgi:ribonuclease E
MTTIMTSVRYHALRLRWALSDNRPAIVAFALLLIASGVVSLGRILGTRAQAEPAPIILLATPTPALAVLPTATPAGPVLPRAAVAYAAPGGLVLGGLEPGRAYVPLARYGTAWLQVDAGSGAVWLDAVAAGLTVDAQLADLEPQPTPVVVVVQEVRQQVVYVAAPAAAPAEPAAAPATGAVQAVAEGASEAAARAAGETFTVASVQESQQAGPMQCSDTGRACYGSKP